MNGMLVNLVLAVFWLCLGLAILVHEHVNEPLKWRLPGNMSPGWLAILLAGYNLIRVLTSWRFGPRPKPEAAEPESTVRPRPAPRLEPPNPDFQFTDTPANTPISAEPKPENKPDQPQ